MQIKQIFCGCSNGEAHSVRSAVVLLSTASYHLLQQMDFEYFSTFAPMLFINRVNFPLLVDNQILLDVIFILVDILYGFGCSGGFNCPVN